jgi:hypothetical protein
VVDAGRELIYVMMENGGGCSAVLPLVLFASTLGMIPLLCWAYHVL